jgi:DMSO reductase anchor subunit
MVAPLSVIVFTVLAGAGQGLLVLTVLFSALGGAGGWGADAVELSLVLMAVGLASSAFHLGRPSRAWRAFTQIRSSWLAREAWTALGCWLAAAALGWLWRRGVPTPALGGLAAALALSTVCCTGKIYSSLVAIPCWRNRWTTPIYLLLALLSGAVLLAALTNALDANQPTLDLAATALAFAAGTAKSAHWREADRKPQTSLAAASRLDGFGAARLLWPPGNDNAFVQRELVRRLSRAHIRAYRGVVAVTAFLAPGILDCAAAGLTSPASAWASCGAAASLALGLLVERWLSFREADPVCAVYYAPLRGD